MCVRFGLRYLQRFLFLTLPAARKKYYTRIFINPNCFKSRVGRRMNVDAIMRVIVVMSTRDDPLKYVH